MNRLTTTLALLSIALSSLEAQGPGRPDPAVQKAAMEKLRFLAGNWSGGATVSAGPGKQINLVQTEQVGYRLDGTILVIEGTGRDESGKIVFNAFAVVSFDQSTSKYVFRAWNAGNFAETELKVAEAGFEWGFQQGPITMINRMNIDGQGRWVETGEAAMADGRKLHSVTMLLSRRQ